MGYLLGTDEAGYGPNLGPLVITATLWHVPGDPREVNLYQRLAPAVTDRSPAEGDASCLVIADSKQVYRNGQGLAVLERAVLAALEGVRRRPTTWRGLWDVLIRQAGIQHDELPWHAGFDCELPLSCDAGDLCQAIERWQTAAAMSNVRLCKIQSRALFPREFNQQLDACGGKGALLSQATVELVADVLAGLPCSKMSDEPVWVICDKHGGRNRYGPLLQWQFSDPWIEIRQESRARSVYRWTRDGQTVEAHFCCRAESHLPVAAASMVSKYLREAAMRPFNDFWRLHVPGLRPTAGYPTDAQRFKADIAAQQRRLKIPDEVLWRRK